MNELICDVVYDYVADGGQLLKDCEDALVGCTCGRGDTRPLYEYNKCLEIFMIRGDMCLSEAVQWVEFNVIGVMKSDEGPEMVDLGYEIDIPPKGVLKINEIWQCM